MKISILICLIALLFFIISPINGQTNTVDIKKSDGTKLVTVTDEGKVGIGTSSPDASAILEVKSTGKGVLFPRMTELERSEITSPVVGLIIFNVSTNCINYYTGTEWFELCGNSDCINNGGIDCSSPADLGTICGDTGSDNLIENGCGDAWFTFELSECEASPPNELNDLTLKITLDSPAGVRYDLYLYDSQCGSPIASSKQPAGLTDEVTSSVTDIEAQSDTKLFYIEVRKISGSSSSNWNLSIVGNVTI